MERIPIGAAVKRQIRQRCGFGCVLCGSPIFDYEHILGYTKTGNDPDHMTLLCPAHHREKTAGRLPIQTVLRADRAPHNFGRHVGSRMPLYFEGSAFVVQLGNTVIESSLEDGAAVFALTVDDQEILGVRREGHRLQMEMLLRDGHNRPLLVVRGGQLRHSTRHWDVEYVGKVLTIRNELRGVALRLRLEPPDRIVVEHGDIWANGIHFLIGTAAPLGGFRIDNDGVEFSSVKVTGAADFLHLGSSTSQRVKLFALREQTRRAYGGNPVPFGSFRK